MTLNGIRIEENNTAEDAKKVYYYMKESVDSKTNKYNNQYINTAIMYRQGSPCTSLTITVNNRYCHPLMYP